MGRRSEVRQPAVLIRYGQQSSHVIWRCGVSGSTGFTEGFFQKTHASAAISRGSRPPSDRRRAGPTHPVGRAVDASVDRGQDNCLHSPERLQKILELTVPAVDRLDVLRPSLPRPSRLVDHLMGKFQYLCDPDRATIGIRHQRGGHLLVPTASAPARYWRH